jgi:hypothetical protein
MVAMSELGTWIVGWSLGAFALLSGYWFFRDRHPIRLFVRLSGVGVAYLVLRWSLIFRMRLKPRAAQVGRMLIPSSASTSPCCWECAPNMPTLISASQDAPASSLTSELLLRQSFFRPSYSFRSLKHWGATDVPKGVVHVAARSF